MFYLVSPILWVIVIVVIVSLFRRKRHGSSSHQEAHLRLAQSREDAVSQLFLLISFVFLGITLVSIDRDLSNYLGMELLGVRLILFVTSCVMLAGSYYFKAAYPLILSLFGFVVWWYVQAMLWSQSSVVVYTDGIGNIKPSVLFTGFVLFACLWYAVSFLHTQKTKWKQFALVYEVLGLIGVTATFFFLSTQAGLSTLESMTEGSPIWYSWQLFLSLAVLFFGAVSCLFLSFSKRLLPFSETAVVLGFLVFFAVLALLPEQMIFLNKYSYIDAGRTLTRSGVAWAIILNAAAFFEIVGLILSGYVRRVEWRVNIGILFMFFLIIVKYFDWFFTFLDKSLFFIGAGILLFVLGWGMERGRRYMIGSMKTG